MCDAILGSIADQLNELSEKYLIDAISQDAYAFGVHDLLGNVPTARAPAHLLILRHIRDWKATELITAEQATNLQQRIVAASKG